MVIMVYTARAGNISLVTIKKGEITLAPNDVMASQTKAGSFKTIVATFDKATSTFNFLTEVKDVNGYVHQVNEIIRRQ